MPSEVPTRPPSERRRRWGWKLALIVAGMVGFAFINVPLFRVFCTHLGIYVPQDEKLAASVGPVDASRDIHVSFSGVIATGLHVGFQPDQPLQTAHIGQRMENKFTFTNDSNQTVRFRAIHDIFPAQAATHLALIQCFCFSDQTMAPHTSKTLPVIYQLNTGLDPLVARVSLMYTLEPLAPANPAGSGEGGQ
jgi:cytochrome c oxidase assembly protein subunit 11